MKSGLQFQRYISANCRKCVKHQREFIGRYSSKHYLLHRISGIVWNVKQQSTFLTIIFSAAFVDSRFSGTCEIYNNIAGYNAFSVFSVFLQPKHLRILHTKHKHIFFFRNHLKFCLFCFVFYWNSFNYEQKTYLLITRKTELCEQLQTSLTLRNLLNFEPNKVFN